MTFSIWAWILWRVEAANSAASSVRLCLHAARIARAGTGCEGVFAGFLTIDQPGGAHSQNIRNFPQVFRRWQFGASLPITHGTPGNVQLLGQLFLSEARQLAGGLQAVGKILKNYSLVLSFREFFQREFVLQLALQPGQPGAVAINTLNDFLNVGQYFLAVAAANSAASSVRLFTMLPICD